MANSANHHCQSTSQGTVQSDTMWCCYWNVQVFCHADDISAIMFAEKHFLWGLAVHFARRHHKCQLSDIMGSCTHQAASHQWQNTIPHNKFTEKLIQKILSTVPVDCHKLINASSGNAGSNTRKQFFRYKDYFIWNNRLLEYRFFTFLFYKLRFGSRRKSGTNILPK